ncbi:MAG TPA: hypothetical protein PKD64_13100 [Pirellulaceae bacterium]|nr:hypothetical protein [Pirellulaceae bacterium]HMO93124.1 hypothetical protein [Pirellulaceae bacterium]HMP70317.1 hypothetical protein [Pirellulaceae bacterium]
MTLELVVLGSLICVGGIILILRHFHVWRKSTDATDDPLGRRYHKSQLRRRCLMSAGIAVLGLIIIGFPAAFHFKDPFSSAILLLAALSLTVMILLLAGLDMMAAKHFLVREKAKSEDAKHELMKEHERLKQKLKQQESADR